MPELAPQKIHQSRKLYPERLFSKEEEAGITPVHFTGKRSYDLHELSPKQRSKVEEERRSRVREQ